MFLFVPCIQIKRLCVEAQWKDKIHGYCWRKTRRNRLLQQAERRAGKCFQSSLNKRQLNSSCQLQSVTCFLYLKQDTFTSRSACRGSEDYLPSGNTCYWLTCMLLAWLTATMIIATPPCQRAPWSEVCTFYGRLSIMYPFSSTRIPEPVVITGSQTFSHRPR